MKKFLLFFAVLNFSILFSQCAITGAETIEVGEKQIYKVTGQGDICADCYEWSYPDQKIIFEGETNKSEIKLKGSVPGDAVFSVKINSINNPLKCSKQIKVIEPTTNFRAGDNEKCEIQVEAFKEIKVGEKKVAFEAETAEENYTYLWTAFYRDGTQKKSTHRKPQFEVTNDHVIDKVEVQVTLKTCTKKISKSYHSNFWYFF